jgi:hypothetical protein
MEPITITLSKPIQHGPTKISELVISRELEAGDLRDMPAAPEHQTVGHVLDIIGKLANQPPTVMSKLGAKDIAKVSEAFQRFF